MSKRSDWPRCPHLKRDGAPCGSATRPSDDNVHVPAEDRFCKPHAPKVEPVELEPTAKTEEEPALDVPAPDAQRVDSLRAALRGSVSTDQMADLMGDTLLKALEATRETWSTCPHCHKRHPVALPDLGTRAQAVRSVIELIEGRAKEEGSRQQDELDREVSSLLRNREQLSDVELGELIVRLERELAEEA
jgi:hypothetical protein